MNIRVQDVSVKNGYTCQICGADFSTWADLNIIVGKAPSCERDECMRESKKRLRAPKKVDKSKTPLGLIKAQIAEEQEIKDKEWKWKK